MEGLAKKSILHRSHRNRFGMPVSSKAGNHIGLGFKLMLCSSVKGLGGVLWNARLLYSTIALYTAFTRYATKCNQFRYFN